MFVFDLARRPRAAAKSLVLPTRATVESDGAARGVVAPAPLAPAATAAEEPAREPAKNSAKALLPSLLGRILKRISLATQRLGDSLRTFLVVRKGPRLPT